MSLLDDVSSSLPAMRQQAESLMLDRLEFGSMTRGGQNEDSGLEEPTFTAAFSTPGKVSGRGTGDQAVRMVEVGGTQRPIIDGGVHIPSGRRETVTTGMLVRVAKLGPNSPKHMLGRVYRVEGESTKSYQTARRFDVVELP